MNLRDVRINVVGFGEVTLHDHLPDALAIVSFVVQSGGTTRQRILNHFEDSQVEMLPDWLDAMIMVMKAGDILMERLPNVLTAHPTFIRQTVAQMMKDAYGDPTKPA